MPYIRQNFRKEYDPHIDQINQQFQSLGFEPGHIVYIVFRMMKFWWHSRPGFATINAIRGVMWSVTSEFDRVVAGPYEDKKIDENGDIG